MGIFARFEKKVEGAVNGVFARAFKGDVQPVEIAARLQRELDAEAKLMSRDKRLVPNEFTVNLSQHDHDKLAPYANTLNAQATIRSSRANPRSAVRHWYSRSTALGIRCSHQAWSSVAAPRRTSGLTTRESPAGTPRFG